MKTYLQFILEDYDEYGEEYDEFYGSEPDEMLVEDNYEGLKNYLENGGSPDFTANKTKAIIWACEYSTLEIVKLLLDYGANIDEIGSHGTTPLLGAISTGNYEVIKYLLSIGIKVYQQKHHNLFGTTSDYGNDALSELIWSNHLNKDEKEEILKMLIDSGTNVNNWYGGEEHSPLQIATMANDLNLVKILLENGAKPDYKNVDKETFVDVNKKLVINDEDFQDWYLSKYGGHGDYFKVIKDHVSDKIKEKYIHLFEGDKLGLI